MSSDYTKKVLKIVLGQLCQAVGFHSIQQSTLDVLTSIFDQYLRTLANQSGKYAEHGKSLQIYLIISLVLFSTEFL